MAQQWFVRTGNGEVGPMTSTTLLNLVQQNRVGPQTEVRTDVSPWVPAAKVKGLFPAMVAPKVREAPPPSDTYDLADPDPEPVQAPWVRTEQDPSNPYSAPTSDLRPPRRSWKGKRTRIPFTISSMLGQTWNIYRNQMVPCILVVIACFALGLGIQCLAMFLNLIVPGISREPVSATLFTVMITILAIVFQLWLNVGLASFMLNTARGRYATFSDLFSGGPFLLNVTLATFLLGLVLFGATMACILPLTVAIALVSPESPGAQVMPLVGQVVSVLVTTIILIRTSQYIYIIIDQAAGPLESLKLSFEVTRGQTLRLFLMFLVIGLINIVGLLAFGVGLVLTFPYMLLMLAVVYLSLTGQPAADLEASMDTVAEDAL